MEQNNNKEMKLFEERVEAVLQGLEKRLSSLESDVQKILENMIGGVKA